MKQIVLGGKYGKDKFALVDDEDYEYLNKFHWHVSSHGYVKRGSYIGIKKKHKIIGLSREIMGFPKGMEIDHINHNKLDNQKGNLRICTKSQNMMNKLPKIGSSKFKGVGWNKREKIWQSKIKKDNKWYFLGYFIKETDAAKAYNKKAKELFGEYAHVNRLTEQLNQRV